MKSKKEIAKLKDQDLLQYVVRHGEWRMRRGKRPSAVLPMPYGIFNPQEAYKGAKKILNNKASISSRLARRRRMLVFGKTLGIPSPYEEPWPGARKVPHTCYQWY